MFHTLGSRLTSQILSTGHGYCHVFLEKTLNFHSANLYPAVYTDTGELLRKPDKIYKLGWTSFLSKWCKSAVTYFVWTPE